MHAQLSAELLLEPTHDIPIISAKDTPNARVELDAVAFGAAFRTSFALQY
jgi:hypothetical protein